MAVQALAAVQERVLAKESSRKRSEVRREAFDRFVEQHYQDALRLAWHLLGDQSTSEDVVQDAFVKAFKGFERFRGEASIKTWFTSILIREVNTRRRRTGVWKRLLEAVKWSRPVQEVSPGSGDPSLREALKASVAGLPKGQREAFILVVVEGFTYQEAGESMGLAAGSVKSHVHRARASLKRTLRSQRGERDE